MPIYDRQHDEPDVAWTVFSLFRNSGRSRKLKQLKLDLTSKGLDYLIRELPRWRRRYNWDQRIKTYDADIEFRLIRQLDSDQRAVQASFTTSGRTILAIVAEWIDVFNQRVREVLESDSTADPLGIREALSKGDGMDWLTKAAKLVAMTQQIAGEAAPVKININNEGVAALVADVFASNGARLDAVLNATGEFAALAVPVEDVTKEKAAA